VAILEWTGAKDVVTSDIVLDWTSTTYTPGNFFLAANLNVLAVADLTTALNTWRTVDATAVTSGLGLTATVGASANNLIVFVWSTATLATGVTIQASRFKLEKGAKRSGWNQRSTAEEQALCLRHYRKSFPSGVAPAQNTGSALGALTYRSRGGGAASLGGAHAGLAPPMRVSPTLTFFNPSAVNDKWRNLTDAADSGQATSLAAVAGDSGFFVSNTEVAGDGAGEPLAVHWTAEAEL
jgi:hypothetical protein